VPKDLKEEIALLYVAYEGTWVTRTGRITVCYLADTRILEGYDYLGHISENAERS